jgi:hypothetical protein
VAQAKACGYKNLLTPTPLQRIITPSIKMINHKCGTAALGGLGAAGGGGATLIYFLH